MGGPARVAAGEELLMGPSPELSAVAVATEEMGSDGHPLHLLRVEAPILIGCRELRVHVPPALSPQWVLALFQ
jgi:hypothetical protein